MRRLVLRLKCRLFSCELDEHGYECTRCGEWVYGGEHIDAGYITGAIWRVRVAYQRFRQWTGHWQKCDTCGIWFWTHDDSCCSARCYEDWCPF
jgi:hypothetical protein